MVWGSEEAVRFGKALKSLRTANHFTQEQLAYAAGLTKNQIQLFEAGRGSGKAGSTNPANPTMATIAGLASAFDMTVSELFAALDM